MKTLAGLFVIALFLHGCTYAISPAFVDRADKTVSFEKLQADPESHKGKILILGGTIFQTSGAQQGTLIEVIQKQLDYWGKPERTRSTGGRFLILHPSSLDPMIYAPGREITIAGEVQGVGSPTPGEQRYEYPLLISRELKLWEQDRPSWNKPQWIDPLYDPNSPSRHD